MMILQKILRVTQCLGLLTALAPLLHASPYAAFVEEDVDLMIAFRSLADSREAFEDSPFQAIIADPDLEAFLEPLLERSKGGDDPSMGEILESEFDLDWDGLFALFPGPIAFALHNVPERILQEAERSDLTILAEFSGSAERLDALMQIQFERNASQQKEINPAIEHTLIEESFMGETLYFDEVFDGESSYIEDGYALVDGIFILATPEARLRSAVEAIKEGAAAPLAQSEMFLRCREEGGRGDFQIFLNLGSILPSLNEAMTAKAMSSGAAMFGLSPESIDATFSLGSLQAFFLDFDLIADGLESNSGLIFREKAGLLKLLTYTGAPLPDARYIPEGVFSSSITNFDLGEMFVELENLLIAASPMMRMQIDAQLQNVKSQTGVDLRSAILENFTEDFVTLSSLSEGGGAQRASAIAEPDQIYVIGIRDSEALRGAFEALKDKVPGLDGQLETKEFAGQTIHTFRPPTQPGAGLQAISYSISRTHFFLSIGRPDFLQEVLSQRDRGAGGFWQLSVTEDLFDRIAKDDAITRSFIDLEKMVGTLFTSLVQLSQAGGASAMLDPENIPEDFSFPFHLVSEANEAEDGLFSRTLVILKEDAK